MIFKNLVSGQHRFFDILPQDWQDDILPYWNNHKKSSSIFVLEKDRKIFGGGISFSTCPPDIEYYRDEAEIWFKNGYLYLGFIFIQEHKRNGNWGTFWLDQLKKSDPGQNYWLLTEEAHLQHFYEKNGFALVKSVIHKTQTEWLYCYTSP